MCVARIVNTLDHFMSSQLQDRQPVCNYIGVHRLERCVRTLGGDCTIVWGFWFDTGSTSKSTSSYVAFSSRPVLFNLL